jgi:MoxR-like ATPase
MFSLNVVYPKFEEEVDILLSTTQNKSPEINKVVTAEEIVETQTALREIHIPRSVAQFAVKLASSTRPDSEFAPDFIKKYLRWGAGPRACQFLALAGKVYAALDNRFNVTEEDIVKTAHSVLGHRLVLNYHAEADLRTAPDIIDELIGTLKK